MKFHFIKICCALFIVVFGMTACSDSNKEKQPNIIFFLVDDMGWQDTSVPFWKEETPLNKKFHTPNMDRLAADGMKFTQAYASCVCSPTRCSIMSGMNAARHRVTNWTLYKNQTTDNEDDVLVFPKWNVNGIQPVGGIERSTEVTTLPTILQQNGYFTIHCGKAHWGAKDTPGANPLNLGFDVNIGGHCAGGPGSYLGIHNFSAAWRNGGTIWDIPGLEKYHGKDINVTEALTIEAEAAMDSAIAAGKPFYLYMAHYAVHVPLEPHNPFYQKYKEMGLEEPEARYASMVEGMDKSLGDLMDHLDEKGLAENTIILFMSDNGGLSAHGRGGTPNTHNKPLNSGKGSAYEGGIREPMIVKWPGTVEAGSVCNDYLIIEDFFPSILEIAGVSGYQTKQVVDGQSFVPMLKQKGTTADGRDLYWHFPNKWGASGPGIGTTSTIRSGDWKLIYWYKDQHFELFNLAEDIGEKNNLVVNNPEKVEELAVKLSRHLREMDALRPLFKESGEPVPWPDEI
ncbi:sulfatase [Maribellus maritimus]|uniref:sulfatase n=1 Tax=Maribellus maritimus TaxID=2870838 RepID=UPI001EEAA4B3|nr:sulfatase [Maribellus maritimus]MCG6190050.1 sulfatase [Maribellus maritimus]